MSLLCVCFSLWMLVGCNASANTVFKELCRIQCVFKELCRIQCVFKELCRIQCGRVITYIVPSSAHLQEDRQLNHARQPALKKLKMLPTVITNLKK